MSSRGYPGLEAFFQPESAEDAALLARAALPRRLDDAVLGVLELDPGRLARLSAAEPTRSGFRIDPVARDWQLDLWRERSPDPEFAQLSRRLAEHYSSVGDDVESLYHRLAVDFPEASKRFGELYRAADEAFDLTRCRDLLDVLAAVGGADAQRLYDEYAARYDARGQWIDDWYSSARFLQPETSRASIAALLDGSASVLHLWARGGMGKTMQLRHLIARQAVPSGFACARIDFDHVDAGVALEEPWLVLLELAGQLNPQLPGRPFEELDKQFGPHRERLQRVAPIEEITETESEEDDEAIGAGVRRAVVSTLSELPATHPILLVLDTLEVPLFAGGKAAGASALARLLDTLRPLADAPAVRLVLAGRYDLTQEIAGFSELFPEARPLRLKEFDDDQARRYLLERRGVTDARAVEAAVDIAGGVPFKLALLADTLQRGDVTAEKLRRFGDPDLAYLVLRVLDRIEPATRWILRYGAVPRVLTRAFVERVMAPLLEAGMRGEVDIAEPKLDLPGRPGDAVTFPKLLGPEDELDLDAMWAQLKSYAGEASWVRPADSGHEALVLHGDVTRPMRALLAKHGRQWDRLHEDALAYFESLAKDDALGAARWRREAVFHRFQRYGPEAAGYWRKHLRALDGPTRAADRRALARELLGEDYVDDGRPREWRKGLPIIEEATLHEAAFEEAWATIQQRSADGLPSRSRIAEARETIGAGPAVAELVGPARFAMPATIVDLLGDDLAAAEQNLQIALAGDTAPEDRVWLLERYAEALSGRSPHRAIEAYEWALGIVTDTSDPSGWRERLERAAAELGSRHDRFEHAIARLDRLAREVGDPAAVARAELGAGELRLRVGEAGRAVQAAERHRDHAEADVAVRARVLLVEARLARLEVGEASTALADLRRTMSRGLHVSKREMSRELATLAELSGRAAVVELDATRATNAYAEATQLWRRAGEDDRATLCAAEGARALLHDLGDVRQAATLLDSAGRAHRTSEGHLRAAILRAEIAQRSLEAERARRLVADAHLEVEAADAPVRVRVDVLLATAAIAPPETAAAALSRVPDLLETITPMTARLRVLGRLRACPVVPAAAEAYPELAAALPEPARLGVGDPVDASVLTLPLAEVARVCGRRDEAAALLGGVLARLDAERDPALLLATLDALRRLGVTDALARRYGLRCDISPLDKRLLAESALDTAVVVLGRMTGVSGDRFPEQRRLLDSRQLAGAGRYAALAEQARASALVAAGDHEGAVAAAQQAAGLYEALGDDAASLAVGQALGGFRTAGGDDEPDVGIGLRGSAFVVQTPGSEAQERAHRIAAAFGRRRGRRETFPRELWDVLELGPHAAAPTLADVLAPLRRSRSAELALSLRERELHAVPWECAFLEQRRRPVLLRRGRTARPSTDEVLSLQRALQRRGFDVQPDGILGAQTSQAVTAFQRNAGLGRRDPADPETFQRLFADWEPSVTVVRPPQEAELRSRRGSASSGAPVEWYYRDAGFTVTVLEAPSPEQLVDHCSAQQPGLVHVSTGLLDAGGAPTLDVSGSGASSWGADQSASQTTESLDLTAALLGAACEAIEPRPIVVLDPHEPRGSYETVAQLLLRNAFAAELAAAGAARAVLGLGLESYDRQDTLYGHVAARMWLADPVGDVIRAIQEEDARDSWGFAAPVLYARSTGVRPAWGPR